jgi:hypothetical protein
VKRPLVILALVATLAAGCAAPSPTSSPSSPSSPAPIPSPQVVCDASQFQPPPTLTCGPAIAAAIAALPADHPPVVREEFRWGGLCPPGAPCAPPLGDAGIVIFDFASGPSTFVYVSADAGRVVARGSPAPYPSGY